MKNNSSLKITPQSNDFCYTLNFPNITDDLILPFNLMNRKMDKPLYAISGKIIDRYALVKILVSVENKISQQIIERGETLTVQKMTAMIDTGATRSVISTEYIKDIGLETFIEGKHTVLGEKKDSTNANLAIHIENLIPDKGFLDLCVIVGDMLDKPFNFIIGWDLLRYCQFNYVGNEDRYELTFNPPI